MRGKGGVHMSEPEESDYAFDQRMLACEGRTIPRERKAKGATPKVRIAALFVDCACGNDISGPYSGSMLWNREDCQNAVTAGVIACSCGATMRIPAAVKSLAKAAV